MRFAFTGMASTKGLKIVFDTDTKEYFWTYACVGVRIPTTTLYMPTNKDLKQLEIYLIKNGFMEVE